MTRRLDRTIRVQDDHGKKYEISRWVTSQTIGTYDGTTVIDGLGELFLGTKRVNELGNGQYQVIDTGLILHEAK